MHAKRSLHVRLPRHISVRITSTILTKHSVQMTSLDYIDLPYGLATNGYDYLVHQDDLLLLSGLGHGCCHQHHPPQPLPIYSMLASHTSSPEKGRSAGIRQTTITQYISIPEIGLYSSYPLGIKLMEFVYY